MSVQENLAEVLERINAAKARGRRHGESVRVMAVSKTRSAEEIDEARGCGLSLFGENRVQEAMEKYATARQETELHLIGHLQRNKARHVPGLFSAVQSIDSNRTAKALNDAVASAGHSHRIDIYLEVNISGEASKHGYRDLETLQREVETIATMEHLRIVGLMTLAAFTNDESVLRRSFSGLREQLHRLQGRFAELNITELSMGMSNDYEIAVEEGSTMVRLGTVLFGPRWGGVR